VREASERARALALARTLAPPSSTSHQARIIALHAVCTRPPSADQSIEQTDASCAPTSSSSAPPPAACVGQTCTSPRA
jgi:hypothetical protein